MRLIPLHGSYQILVDVVGGFLCIKATVVWLDGSVVLTRRGAPIDATCATEEQAIVRCAMKFGGYRERGLI
jgi:hypothetical protein